MKVNANSMRVVSKSMKHFDSKGDRAEFDIYEVQCTTGEGSLCNLNVSPELYDLIVPFVEYDGDIDLYMRGYNLRGELLNVYER